MRTILVLVITCLCHVFTHAQTTLTFDGVDDYTQTNYYNQLDLGTGNFALEAMISNLDFTISDTLTILSQQNTNSTQGICWSITNNTIHVQIEGIAYSMNHTFTGCTHLAVVRDNGELLFYANSNLLGSQSIAMAATTNCSNCDLLMGKTVNDSNYFKGTLDEVRIWNTNRSGTDISSYETSCLDSIVMSSPSLVGYWNFEENAGQFANNLGSIAHYTRLGNTFYSDNDDPTWTTTSCVSSTCYANGLASFTLSDNDPKEADLVLLSYTSINSSVVYWSINGDTTLSVDSLQYAFPLGMNIIQLAVTSASGLSVRTILLDVKRPKYPCGADEYTDWRRLNDRNYPRTRSLLYQAASAARSGSSGKEYHIPVIFHVIADNQATLNAFPTSRIQAQLDTLNKYFAKDSTGISFCLAQEPLSLTGSSISWSQYGTTVPGITYLLDTLDEYDFTNQTYVNELMRQLPFDAKEYLNIYIVDTIINPGSSFLGVASVGPNYSTFDGIGLDYDVFVGGAIGPMGKSLVHEVGHWLGLEHVFEPDGICDTYEQFHPTSDSGITNCSTPYSYGTSCPPNPVYNRGQNHMDYHSEPCLTVFTGGQIDRMHYILDNGRPYVHSEYNLIATKVQALGACVNKTNASAVFIASSESVCVGSTVELKGVEIPLSHWAWQISWDPNKNNGNPAPSTSGSCLSTSPSFGNSFSNPGTMLSICEPGIWDVSLIINDTSRSTSIPIITIDTHSMSIEVLDCSPSDQRNRVTLSFDSTDWQINGATIDNLDAIANDTTAGHIVSGTGYILNQNSEGVVMRTTVFGSPLWRRAIRIPNADVELFDVVSGVSYQGTDRIALAGRVKRGSTSELLLVIVDRAGNMLFQETYQMTKNGNQQANAVGLELIQFSNNDLAIVGFVGDLNVDSISTDKRGFILGVNPITGVQWEHYFESAKYTSTIDYDIAENVTEIVGEFGNGPEAAIVISGHSNRTQGTNTGSGTFISCLTISGGIVTEQWRKNVEFPSGVGSNKPVAVAYDNGRLFFVSFNSLLHGSLIIEIDPNTGNFGIEALIQNLYPVDLIIDGANLILGGRNLSTDVLAAAKIPIPAVATTNFALPSITVRTYSDTETKGDWGGLYNVSSYIKTPQSIVPSINGGYMLIGEYAPNTISVNNFNDIGLVFNKIDNELITTCMDGGSYPSSLSNFNFGYITHADSTQLTTSLGIDTISCDSLITTCYQLGCLTPSYTLNSFNFSKCPLDSVILVGSFSEIGNFSYQWSPSIDLSSDTVLTPTTTTPTAQTYNLIITDNTTGCQVAEADYIVTIPMYTSMYNVPCLGLDTNLYTYNIITNENEINLSYLLASENIPQGGNWVVPFSINSFINTIGDDILHFSGPLDSFSEIHYRFGDCDDRVAIFYLGLSGNILGSSSQTICSGETITFQGVNGVGWTHQWIVIPPGLPPFVAGTGPNLTYTFNFNPLLSTGTHGYLVYHRVSQPCAIDSLLYSTPPNFSNFEEVYVGVYNSAVNINLDTCTGVLHLTGNRPGENIQWYDAITGLAILGETTENYNPATSGSYYATVRNPQCDLISDTFNYMPLLHISSTATVNSNYNGADISCFGASDGAAMVTISNGLSPYTYLWSNGDTLATATGLAVGNYQVTVIDACMDTTIASVTLTEPTALTISVDTIIAASCSSIGDGSATVIGSGGTAPYTYLWSNGSNTATTNNLSAIPYTVTLTDANGCFTSVSITGTAPTPIVATMTNVNTISCSGGNNGTATASVSGGTSPYTYLWSSGEITNTATALSGGFNSVTITDANNCTATGSVLLTQPLPVSTSINIINNITCSYTTDGSVQVNATGGTNSYTYLWSNGQTNALVTGLSAGTYTVTVSDGNNCTIVDSITLTAPTASSITTTGTNVSCYGLSDGGISTTVIGTTTPYTYLWSNGSTSQNPVGLVANSYTLTLTDVNTCTLTASQNITEPAELTNTSTPNNPTCTYSTDGSIQISATGGTPSYTYLWNNGQNTAIATGLSVGTHYVTITDANSCTIIDTIDVTAPTPPIITTTGTNVSCYGLSDGRITTTVVGTTTPYSYLWSNGSMNQNPVGLAANSYTLTLTDVNACTLTASQTITEPTELTNTSIPNNPTCTYSTNGSIQTNATGGTPLYTYLWGNGQTNALATGLSVGTHYVTITDANNCAIIDTISLTAPVLPTITATGINVSCNGLSDGGITTTVIGSTAPYTYLWSNSSTSTNITGLGAASYGLTVTDANGCTLTASQNITEPTILTSTFNSNSITCANASSGSITNTVSGGTAPYTYLWSNGETSQDIVGLSDGIYCVTITDANNCTFVNCDTLAPAIDVSVDKSISTGNAQAGDIITYTITIENNCQSSTNFVVLDTLPIGLLLTDPNGFTYNPVDRTLNNIVPVAGGSSVSVSFMAQIIGDGRCNSRLLIDNKAYVNAQGTSSPVFVDSVRLRVRELVDACDTSLMSITFDDAINAGVLLPMAGAVNATNTPQNVVVNGTWRLNGNYTFALGSVVTMEGGAEMIISAGAALTIDSSSFEGCNCLWHRILVETDGRIITRNTAELKDAQYAIQALDQSLLDISETSFLNNFIGIYVAPSKGNNIFFLQFLNNEFRSRDIKEPFAGIGETPAYTRGQDIIGISVPTGTGQPARQQGLAGIYIWDITSLNLNTPQPSNSNLFRNLTSGIVAFQSNLSVNSCEFQSIVGDVSIYPTNLAFQGCGIHAQSDGGVHNLKVEGMIDASTSPLSGTNTFRRCDVGISGLGVSMDIAACGLNNIQTAGIRSMSCFSDNISIKGSRMNRIRRVGIELFNCDVNTPTIIASNEVDMSNVTSAVPMFRAGISVVESGVNPNFLDITENKIISRNSQFGIVVNGHREGGIIRSNEVEMRGNYAAVDRAGISILNSSIALSCNDVKGNRRVLRASNTFGILGSIAGGEWSCNTVDSMATGVFFDGFNDVELQGTVFDNHKNGLLINSSSSIGIQSLNGNRWIGGLNSVTNPDALDNGGFSQFIIQATSFSSLLPNNYLSLPNLINLVPFGTNYDCNSPQLICGATLPQSLVLNPNINARDIALANNTFATTTNTLTTGYLGKRKLYRKLLENPNLLQTDPTLPSFVTNNQVSCIGHFDKIEQQCSQIFALTTGNSIQLDSFQNQCKCYLDSLHCLDSILCINHNSVTENQRNNIANKLSILTQQQQVFLTNIMTDQQSDLVIEQATNSNYSTTILHEQLEKQINEIYLNTLAKGIAEITSTEITVLQTIATYCPAEGGVAVHQARGILSLFQDIDMLDFDCDKKKARKGDIQNVNGLRTWEVVLYPNPAKEQLTIQSNIELDKTTNLEIYNLLGQQLAIRKITKETTSIDLNISTFIDGVYIIRVQKDGEVITKSFVVSK